MNTSSDNLAINVEGVTKSFALKSAGRTLKGAVLDALRARNRAQRYKALDNVSFSVKRGETLGIIGANGAGKSTLLGLVAGTLRADSGKIETRGSIASLLELGAGFHPDLTGRENVFLYGSIMGIPQQRMAERFEAIAQFAGIGDYMEQPVKHYSSGMYVRLGFAVAVEADPDILLVDEVLAVGDSAFQKKCIARMNAFREAGKTMLIISHDIPTIRDISDRILILDRGVVKGFGAPDEMVNAYKQGQNTASAALVPRRDWGTGEAEISALRAELGGSSLALEIDYDAHEEIKTPVIGFSIADENGRVIHGSNTQIAGIVIPSIKGKGTARVAIDLPPLAQGEYFLSAAIHSSDHRQNYHRVDNITHFHFDNPAEFDGVVEMPSKWKF